MPRRRRKREPFGSSQFLIPPRPLRLPRLEDEDYERHIAAQDLFIDEPFSDRALVFVPPRYRGRGHDRERDVATAARVERERLPYGFVVTRLPPGFARDRWELQDAGGRVVARGTAVDWHDTRRLAEIALHRHLQKTGTERDVRSRTDVTERQRAFIREKIPILIDEGYPPRQAVAIAYRMAGVPPRGRSRRR